jgi:hypothetical protein|tara:strand:- start:851 stop:1030 length:180 start_codon:yes stop_codon:yes gene_type:complete
MAKKKHNLISIIPAFFLIGVAIGIQTKNLTKHSVIGLLVGVLIYFLLSYRNKNSNKIKQ